MTVDALVSRLEGVRPCGKGYAAKCPAHEDRSASLSVCEADNGNALVHCFAGCSTRDIVAALGLRMGDLFARPLGEEEHKRRATRAILKGLYSESLRVICATSSVHDADRDRLKTASARLRAALTVEGLEARGEIRKVADYADRLLAGEALDETELGSLTACVERLGRIADEQKAGERTRPEGELQHAERRNYIRNRGLLPIQHRADGSRT